MIRMSTAVPWSGVVGIALAALLACGGCSTGAPVTPEQTSLSVPSGEASSGAPASTGNSVEEPAAQSPTVSTPKVTDARVLEEMRWNFGKSVKSAKVEDDGDGNVRIDVYTSYHADKDVADKASGMARIAAGLSCVTGAYSQVKVSGYVWPATKEFYMTRATASWTDGHIDEPMEVYVNDVLK